MNDASSVSSLCRAVPLAILLLTGDALAAGGTVRHGISVFGDLKYAADFAHFDYVNPDAPKTGELRLHGIDSFDNLNPFIVKGVSVIGVGLVFDTLMARAMDEPDAQYGLVAESVEMPADRSWILFSLRPEARWHDGSPLTAEDVAFTFETLVAKGHPRYRLALAGVASVEIIDRRRIRFAFKPDAHRDLALQIAGLPVISKSYYQNVRFAETTVMPPLGSGPYRVSEVEIGRFIVFERDPTYWGRDLPVNRGRYNFDRIRVDYYRDRGVAFEAFMAGEYDYREEFHSRRWATQYDKPPVRDGRVVRETVIDRRPSGVQAFFFNLRRKKFQDRRVRRAIDLAFDFEWTNSHLFFDLYRRINSMFENSPLAAEGPPGAAELALLEPWRGQVPAEVFTAAYRAPTSDGSGDNRDNLLAAAALLREAGWTVRQDGLVDASGKPLTIEFLISQASFKRIIGPYLRNLRRLGIDGRIRIVDAANFQQRRQRFDFDVIMLRYGQPLTPGIEQRNYYGSAAADLPGTLNYAGIKDPAVDALIDRVVAAKDRPAMEAAVRALDRVLMWNYFIVPHWYKGTHNIAFWDKFGRPGTRADYDVGVLDTWWYDAERARLIDGGAAPSAD